MVKGVIKIIKTYIGPMFSGKSNGLIDNYKKIWNKANIICFKPKLDDRDMGIIKSRDSEGNSAYCINYIEEIELFIKEETKTIFIDEAQFLQGDPLILLRLSIVNDIDFHIAGLSLTAEQQPFGIMPLILSISNEITIYEAVCYDCNKKAHYTYYDGEKNKTILVGSDSYMPLCGSCLLKRRLKQNKDILVHKLKKD